MTRPVLTGKRKELLLDLIIIVLAFVALIAGRNADGKPADEHASIPALVVDGEFRAIKPAVPVAEPLNKFYTLAEGDTVNALLLENKLAPADVRGLLDQVRPTFDLAKVLPGHELCLSFTPDGARMTGLSYAISAVEKLEVDYAAGSCRARILSVDKVLADGYRGNLREISLTVREGDRLCDLLGRQGICDYQVDRALKGAAEACDLSAIKPGHRLRLWLTPGRPTQLGRLSYEIDDLTELDLRPSGGEFKATTLKRSYQIKLASSTGVVESSLYDSGLKAGLPPEIVMGLTDIFAWDVNFFADIQQGDSYTVLYEKYYVDGQFKRYGNILAATFNNDGERHTAIRFAAADGSESYYDEDGQPMKKLFLKAPLNYRCISSRFSYSRLHPVFKTARPHLGVDYAAPRGTPVVALGRGRVFFKGWMRGFGESIRIVHPAGYVTYYGHLSRFASGLHVGQSVEQGEVVGYVGATGVATGPHLDFRVKHDGGFVNPLKLESVTGDRLKGHQLAEFRTLTAQRFRMIDSSRLNIARRSDNNNPQI